MGEPRLTVLGTPIGNLGDVSDRVRGVLAEADLIAAEDTRRVRRLLSALGIPAGDRLVAVHEHNERAQVPSIVRELSAGRHVVLVSDAGMPTISDPGELLVSAAVAVGAVVEVVPGPSAVVTALAGSGLPADRFVFEGFPPRKGEERREWLETLAHVGRTIVMFEAPTRVRETLRDLASALGANRRAVVCRELTKLHEQYIRGALGELAAEPFPERGEIVLVVEGAGETEEGVSDAVLGSWLAQRLEEGESVRQAAGRAATELGVRRNRAYQAALALSAALAAGSPAEEERSDTLGE